MLELIGVDLWHDFYPSWNLSSREVNQTFSSPMGCPAATTLLPGTPVSGVYW
ncbi:hypothetical protein ABH903_003396 [Brevibacterium epidermidis]|uniref:Uncharacterized protein n=1 Tax=Brevibacterium epidermidis TaxID=1698 RepID=A0ABV4EPU1_BREEP